MLNKAQLDTTSFWSPQLYAKKVCLITGGSNGGMLSEIAKAYLRHGAQAVYLMARKAEKLNAVVAGLKKYG